MRFKKPVQVTEWIWVALADLAGKHGMSKSDTFQYAISCSLMDLGFAYLYRELLIAIQLHPTNACSRLQSELTVLALLGNRVSGSS